MSKIVVVTVFTMIAMSFLAAKEAPTQVINWPDTGSPVVRVTLGKFKEISFVVGRHNYVVDAMAENLWSRKISHLGFNLYLFDKNKVRIGDGWITLDNIVPGQAIKFQTTVHPLGTPVSVELAANFVPPRVAAACPAEEGVDYSELRSARCCAFRGWQ